MQKWQVQAEKHNLIIIKEGDCQLCGSATTRGIGECIEKSAYIPHRLSHDEGVEHMTLFLCVDAYALQHSEMQGRWSIHLHLARLYLMLVEKIQWNYSYTPILSSVVDAYKIKHRNETIAPPAVKSRGAVTVTDVEKANSDSQYIALVNSWALGAFKSYNEGHQIAQRIAEALKTKVGITSGSRSTR